MAEQPTGRLRWRSWTGPNGMGGGRVLQQEFLRIKPGSTKFTWDNDICDHVMQCDSEEIWRDVPTVEAGANDG